MGRRGVSSLAMAMAMAVVLLAVAVMAPGAAAQAGYPQCAQRLIPCAQYIGTTTTPPDSCCGQIREAVQNELTCLCSLLSNKQLLEGFKINVAQALELPKRCGINSDASICGSTSSRNTTNAASPSAPPATPGGDKSAAVVGTAASGLVVLLAFWWSVVA